LVHLSLYHQSERLLVSLGLVHVSLVAVVVLALQLHPFHLSMEPVY
jgi:hypothetical protein